jgi:hypothetical protein
MHFFKKKLKYLYLEKIFFFDHISPSSKIKPYEQIVKVKTQLMINISKTHVKRNEQTVLVLICMGVSSVLFCFVFFITTVSNWEKS